MSSNFNELFFRNLSVPPTPFTFPGDYLDQEQQDFAIKAIVTNDVAASIFQNYLDEQIAKNKLLKKITGLQYSEIYYPTTIPAQAYSSYYLASFNPYDDTFTPLVEENCNVVCDPSSQNEKLCTAECTIKPFQTNSQTNSKEGRKEENAEHPSRTESLKQRLEQTLPSNKNDTDWMDEFFAYFDNLKIHEEKMLQTRPNLKEEHYLDKVMKSYVEELEAWIFQKRFSFYPQERKTSLLQNALFCIAHNINKISIKILGKPEMGLDVEIISGIMRLVAANEVIDPRNTERFDIQTNIILESLGSKTGKSVEELVDSIQNWLVLFYEDLDFSLIELTKEQFFERLRKTRWETIERFARAFGLVGEKANVIYAKLSQREIDMGLKLALGIADPPSFGYSLGAKEMFVTPYEGTFSQNMVF